MNLDSMFNDLLGECKEQGLLKKSANQPHSKKGVVERVEFVPPAKRFKPSCIVLLVHRVTCNCCGHQHSYPNSLILRESVNHKGDKLHSHVILPDEVNLPRRIDTIDHESDMCLNCFGDTEKMPKPIFTKDEPRKPTKETADADEILNNLGSIL